MPVRTELTLKAGEAEDSGDVTLRLSCDPPVIGALAAACLARHPDEEAALLAMRDAFGLAKLREVARERCRQAIEVAYPRRSSAPASPHAKEER